MTANNYLKIFLIVCNGVLILGAAAILIIGSLRVFSEEAPHQIFLGKVLMIGGGVIAFGGFLGCCGACTESTCMLKMYVGKVSGVCVLELISGLVFVFNLSEGLEKAVGWQENNDTLLKGVAIFVCAIQVAAIIAGSVLLNSLSQEDTGSNNSADSNSV